MISEYFLALAHKVTKAFASSVASVTGYCLVHQYKSIIHCWRASLEPAKKGPLLKAHCLLTRRVHASPPVCLFYVWTCLSTLVLPSFEP